MKKWECSVCGYVHEGEEPPDECPVCGADKSAFVLLEEEGANEEIEDSSPGTDEAKKEEAATSPQGDQFKSIKNKIDQAIIDHHLHPITVHIPNGVIPIAVFFLLVGSLFKNDSLITAAYYNITMVFLFMPVVLYTGYIEWINRYKKAKTTVFKTKIIAAIVVGVLSALLTMWKSFSPDAGGAVFIIFHIIMLAGAGVAGHIGGKFVFKN